MGEVYTRFRQNGAKTLPLGRQVPTPRGSKKGFLLVFTHVYPFEPFSCGCEKSQIERLKVLVNQTNLTK